MHRTTFSIPAELKQRMELRPDINWPAVFRQGLLKRLEQLESLRQRGEL